MNFSRSLSPLRLLIRGSARLFPVIRMQSTELENEVGPLHSAIKSKLEAALKPAYIQVFNESYMHNVPKGSESHFKVVVVSELFEGVPLIKRHRLVMGAVEEELNGGVHALSIQAKTPSQWKQSAQISQSPPCLGGSQR